MKVSKFARERDSGLAFWWSRRQDGGNVVNISAIRQKRAWRFVLADSGYIVEVAVMQAFVFIKGQSDPKPFPQRWGVQVWHPRWNQSLSSNAGLAIGEKADWPADEAFLFPAARQLSEEDPFFVGGSGFSNLMDALALVESIALGHEKGKKQDTQLSSDVVYARAGEVDDSSDED